MEMARLALPPHVLLRLSEQLISVASVNGTRDVLAKVLPSDALVFVTNWKPFQAVVLVDRLDGIFLQRVANVVLEGGIELWRRHDAVGLGASLPEQRVQVD